MTLSYGLLIGGEERPALGAGSFSSMDPATGEVLGTLARARAADVDLAVAAAREAMEPWADLPVLQRGRLLQEVARRLTECAGQLAELEARDSGKRLSLAREDVRIAARYFEFFGNIAATPSGEHIPISPQVVDFTVREPYGVCAQINAWNFPLNMAARSLAAALAAGNTVVIKTPELAPLTTAILGRIITDVGFPAGVVNLLHGYGPDCGAALATHPDIDHLTFTGSVETGSQVAAMAAANVVPCTLELGGKSPVVVLADADVKKAASQLSRAFIDANGQSCDLPSLAVVQESVYDQFVAELVGHVEKFTIGPGLEDHDVGALISGRQLQRVRDYIASGVAEGATLAIGGRRPKDDSLRIGSFLEPAVFTDVRPEMRIAREEIFGPVLAVTSFVDEGEAVTIANGTDYGLAAFVWTRDIGAAMRLSRRIRAGQVYVNTFSSGDSVVTPFGGFKKSGYGREKGTEALHTYTQVKNVCFATN